MLACIGCMAISTAQDSALISKLNQSVSTAANDSLRAATYMQLFVAWRNYDSAQAIEAINKAITAASAFGNSQYKGKLMLNKANFLNINGSPNDAIEIMDEVLKMAKASNDNGLAGHTLRSRGIVEFDKNNYDAALQYFVEAAGYYRQSTDKAGEAGNYIWMGNVQNEGLKRHDDAIGSFKTSYGISSSLNDSALMSYSLNNIGQAYYYAKTPDSSLHYYMRSLDIKRLQPDLHALGNVYSNISNIYHEKGEYRKALAYNDIGMVILKNEKDRKGMATSYLNAANSLLKLKRYGEAITNYNQSLSIAQEAGFKEGIYETYAGLAAWHEENGNLGEALRYQRLHKQLYDSMYNMQVGEQIATLERQYETARKEQQITDQQYALNRRNTMLMFSGALLVLGGLLGYSCFRRFRLK